MPSVLLFVETSREFGRGLLVRIDPKEMAKALKITPVQAAIPER